MSHLQYCIFAGSVVLNVFLLFVGLPSKNGDNKALQIDNIKLSEALRKSQNGEALMSGYCKNYSGLLKEANDVIRVRDQEIRLLQDKIAEIANGKF